MLKNAPFLITIGVDPAENEPRKGWCVEFRPRPRPPRLRILEDYGQRCLNLDFVLGYINADVCNYIFILQYFKLLFFKIYKISPHHSHHSRFCEISELLHLCCFVTFSAISLNFTKGCRSLQSFVKCCFGVSEFPILSLKHILWWECYDEHVVVQFVKTQKQIWWNFA